MDVVSQGVSTPNLNAYLLIFKFYDSSNSESDYEIKNIRKPKASLSACSPREVAGMGRFDEIFFEAVDSVLKETLGESISELIYNLVEKHESVKKEEICEKIEVFYGFLEKLFGSSIRPFIQTIQKASTKRLYLELRREYEEVEKYFLYLDSLYEVKFQLLDNLLKGKHPNWN